MMGEVVNLRKARKQAQRTEDEKRAAENRIAHGLPKSERLISNARTDQARRVLDSHRIEQGDEG